MVAKRTIAARMWFLSVVGGGVLAVGVLSARAQSTPVCLQFDTELVTLNLQGGPFPIPLASDPTNALGDSIDGFGLVNSQVVITLSSQRAVSPGPPSPGVAQAFAFGQDPTGGVPESCGVDPIDPDALDGEEFFVDSFFDVFFDITVTDVDTRPGRNFAGQPDGASISLLDNGPANMRSFAVVTFQKDLANFGLIPPPEADPYIGHFLIEIPLGGDINGNGENDKVKFTLASHSAGDQNRQFVVLPDGTILDQFDSAAFLAGAVVDESTDPPFTIGSLLPSGLPDPAAFGGPTTATSALTNTVVPLGVVIDIKPGSDPNSINLKSKGVIPVAILSTRTEAGDAVDFDATQVVPLTVAFGPDGAVEAHGKGHVEDVDSDGDLDLVLHFRTQETGIQRGDTQASLTGRLSSGRPISGSDAVRIVGK